MRANSNRRPWRLTHNPKVLVVQPAAETRGKVAPHHLGPEIHDSRLALPCQHAQHDRRSTPALPRAPAPPPCNGVQRREIWLQALTVWPAPDGPHSSGVPLLQDRLGTLEDCLVAAHHDGEVAFLAPTSPPETGASSIGSLARLLLWPPSWQPLARWWTCQSAASQTVPRLTLLVIQIDTFDIG